MFGWRLLGRRGLERSNQVRIVSFESLHFNVSVIWVSFGHVYSLDLLRSWCIHSHSKLYYRLALNDYG